eukprot:7378949-Prymnesium_polylepis.1
MAARSLCCCAFVATLLAPSLALVPPGRALQRPRHVRGSAPAVMMAKKKKQQSRATAPPPAPASAPAAAATPSTAAMSVAVPVPEGMEVGDVFNFLVPDGR